MFEKIFKLMDDNKELILAAEKDIKCMPELAFREWKTHTYMKERFEKLGYSLVEPGDIPGFYTDVETGRPGPKIAVFGELDALPCPNHPFADKTTGAAHACGHNCQCAALLGLAAALKNEEALEGLCGSIRLIAVPAEEGVDAAMREKLKENNTVRYFAGKPEFLYRGYLDGVDIAMMIHASSKTKGMSCPDGTNGNMRKKTTFIGKAAHAGGDPHNGINALYAATTALSAANALRETFREKDTVRMHPILSNAGSAVNTIPHEVVCENMIRGADYRVIADISRKVNRAFAGAAASMGCRIVFDDIGGSAPRYNDRNLKDIFYKVAGEIFPVEDLNFQAEWGKACSDMGDISNVIPSIHPYIGGASGVAHSENFLITDPYVACVNAAKVLGGVLIVLLSDNGKEAKKVISESKVPFESKEAFFEVKDSLNFQGEGVIYNEDGTATLKYCQ